MTDHATRAREIAVKELVDKFLAWPLPASVCADLCATKQGAPHRSGTTLLNATEAKQMVEHLFTDFIAAALDMAAQEAVTDVKQERDRWYQAAIERAQTIEKLGTELARWDATCQDLTLKLQAAQPVWSKDKPKVAGWYWWRHGGCDRVRYVHAVRDNLLRVEAPDGWFDDIDAVDGEWAGPIPLPQEGA